MQAGAKSSEFCPPPTQEMTRRYLQRKGIVARQNLVMEVIWFVVVLHSVLGFCRVNSNGPIERPIPCSEYEARNKWLPGRIVVRCGCLLSVL